MPPIKRLHYFDRQFLRAPDFIDEQGYHLDMRRRHNRLLHTHGVAAGLDVAFEVGSTSVQVLPGTAIDGQGREIVLADAQTVDLAGFPDGARVFLTIAYAERQTDPTSETGAEGATRWTEDPELTPSATAPTGNDELLLAEIARSGTTVSGVDTSTRRSAGVVGGDLEVSALTLAARGTDRSRWPRVEALPAGTETRTALSSGLSIDAADANAGGLNPGLVLGPGGEGIASKRTTGGNQFGLDLYTRSTPRLTITQAGNVGIGTQTPDQRFSVNGNARVTGRLDGMGGASLNVNSGLVIDAANLNDGVLPQRALQFGPGGEGIASKRTTGGNQFGLDLYTNWVPRLTITQAGNVGIGTQTPDQPLSVNGNARVTGHLNVSGNQTVGTITCNGNIRCTGNIRAASISKATVNAFVIDHPLAPEERHLVHFGIEGPEVGIYYRGQGRLEKGTARIELPDYFEALAAPDQRTVLLTPKTHGEEAGGPLSASAVEDGAFTVRGGTGTRADQGFYWEVKAVRGDIEPYEIEPAQGHALEPATEGDKRKRPGPGRRAAGRRTTGKRTRKGGES